MNCNKTDCIHFKVCQEWKSLDNDNYINNSYGNCENYNPTVVERLQDDLISRSEVVKTLENIEIGKFHRVNVIETIKSISTMNEYPCDNCSVDYKKEGCCCKQYIQWHDTRGKEE